MNPNHSKWNNISTSLTQPQRDALQKGDFQFLGAEIRAVKGWNEEYNLKKQQHENKQREILSEHPILRGTEAINNIPKMISLFSSNEEELKNLGMSNRPPAPDYDYLSCYHEQWQEDVDRQKPKSSNFLKNTKCAFFFPYVKMGDKTLKACEDSRIDHLDRRRFYITNIFVILGIVVTIFSTSPIKAWWHTFESFVSNAVRSL